MFVNDDVQLLTWDWCAIFVEWFM